MPHRYPLEHLDGFVMDVEGREYHTLTDTVEYCYHVAGVVGVMMAYIMGVRDEPTLDRATDLGLAFQLTNICRDVVEDAEVGRVYLPLDWLTEAGVPDRWDRGARSPRRCLRSGPPDPDRGRPVLPVGLARDFAAPAAIGVGGGGGQRGLQRYRPADPRARSAGVGRPDIDEQGAQDLARPRRRAQVVDGEEVGQGPGRRAARRVVDATEDVR